MSHGTIITERVFVESESFAKGALTFTSEETSRFHRDGYVIARTLIGDVDLNRMRQITERGLQGEIAPVEYEADLRYAGSPESLQSLGGHTVRRLKQAHSRDFLFTEWMIRAEILGRLQQLLGPRVVCPLAHHNCIMTKQPQFSSETGWHQDIRYWSFLRPELVNTWIALGSERPENGCLQVIPGSHVMSLPRRLFDEKSFFREDLPENRTLIETKHYVELMPGDVLFFHAKTLHAASRNSLCEAKYSVVFTFRAADNPPLPNTRSASLPELLLTPGT